VAVGLLAGAADDQAVRAHGQDVVQHVLGHNVVPPIDQRRGPGGLRVNAPSAWKSFSVAEINQMLREGFNTNSCLS